MATDYPAAVKAKPAHVALLPGSDSGVIAENVRSLKGAGRSHAHATRIAMHHARKTSK